MVKANVSQHRDDDTINANTEVAISAHIVNINSKRKLFGPKEPAVLPTSATPRLTIDL